MDKLAEEIDHVAGSAVPTYILGVRHTVELTMGHRLIGDNGVLHDVRLATKIHRRARIASLDKVHDLLLDARKSDILALHDEMQHRVALSMT